MGLYLLAGTPGQSKGAAAEKIAKFLRRKGISVGKPANVEDKLLAWIHYRHVLASYWFYMVVGQAHESLEEG